jgi:hypothetical protein
LRAVQGRVRACTPVVGTARRMRGPSLRLQRQRARAHGFAFAPDAERGRRRKAAAAAHLERERGDGRRGGDAVRGSAGGEVEPQQLRVGAATEHHVRRAVAERHRRRRARVRRHELPRTRTRQRCRGCVVGHTRTAADGGCGAARPRQEMPNFRGSFLLFTLLGGG